MHGIRSSPRPWGCFLTNARALLSYCVFPTPVGVFLTFYEFTGSITRLPHARGGVSYSFSAGSDECQSSPRPWGCFRDGRYVATMDQVFPTPVGVFLFHVRQSLRVWCLPHARGGVSKSRPRCNNRSASSPRPWGCFSYLAGPENRQGVFPTPVGVFL